MKNLFKRPRATALFVMDGLSGGKAMLDIVKATTKLSFILLLVTVVESSKSYSVNQKGLHGDLHSDLVSVFKNDNILQYFSRMFDGKGITLALSGDKEVTIFWHIVVRSHQ